MKNIAFGLAGFAAATLSTPAVADPITLGSGDIGDSFTIDFDGFSGDSSSTVDGLSSSITFTLEEIVNNAYTFSYLVENTTDGGVTSNISSFAFNVDPDITDAAISGAYSFAFVADGRGNDPTYPNQIGNVDVCFKSASSGSCSNSGGVSEGNSGSGLLSLFFDPDAPTSITLSDFFVRYQGITGAGGVTSASGQSTTSSSTSGTQVPAPGMIGLLGLGLLGLGAMRRRRRNDEEFAGARPAFA
ncbi:hypothetical protein AAW01_02300 [Aurantiacibacter gangjinensis]|uniref:Ice-binding protein C-terminal domain-containing protein n=2 Tax=Aurantiacibacter gangjinensis TaxID=502682 RepID=A0A0G9MSG6_9SPHN|nr:hypothetical protein AAW01_02300 [Aurantiacibacter gangjinensis]